LYWDDVLQKYRCCECAGGREKAEAIWTPKAKKAPKGTQK